MLRHRRRFIPIYPRPHVNGSRWYYHYLIDFLLTLRLDLGKRQVVCGGVAHDLRETGRSIATGVLYRMCHTMQCHCLAFSLSQATRQVYLTMSI